MNEKSGINIEGYKLFLQHMNDACDHLGVALLMIDEVSGAEARAVSGWIQSSLQTMTDLTNDCAAKVPEQILTRDAENADNIKKGLAYWGERFLPGAVSSVFGTELGRTLVGLEAYVRAGMNTRSSGHVMEIFVRNQHNLFNKGVAELGENMIKPGWDVIIKGLPNEVKTGVSGSADTVIRRINRGDYAHCEKIFTNKENYKHIRRSTGNKKVTNTHVPHKTAEKVAAKGRSLGKQGGLDQAGRQARVDPMMKKFKLGAKAKAGIAGGLIGGGIEAVLGYQDLKNGTISGGQYVNNVAREAVAGAVSGVVSTVAVSALAAAGACGAVTFGAGLVVGAAVSVGVSWLWNDLAETVVPNVTEGAKEVAKSVSTAYETGKVDMKAIGDSCVKDVGNAVKSGAESVNTGIKKMASATNVVDFVEGAAKVVAAPIETALNVAVSATKAVVNTVASAGAAVLNILKKW